MANWVKDIATRLLVSVMAHVVLQVLAAGVLPIAFAVVAVFVSSREALLGIIIAMAAFWAVTATVFILWFNSYRQERADRTLAIARAIYASDRAMCSVVGTQISPEVSRTILQSLVKGLLDELRPVLAYRHRLENKEAAVLLLEGSGPHAAFSVFADVNRDPVFLHRDVEKMTRSHSMAGKSLRDRACLVLRDSHDQASAAKAEWSAIDPASPFRGRATAPIQTVVDHKTCEIGVLSFDVKVPHYLSKEDQGLLQLFADKIAAMWLMLKVPPIPGAEVGIQEEEDKIAQAS